MIESKHLLNILSWLLFCKNIITNYIYILQKNAEDLVISSLSEIWICENDQLRLSSRVKRAWLLYGELTDHEGSWASRIEGLLSIYVFCKKQTNICMTNYSSVKIWFDIIDVELLTPADETSCNTCLTQYITNFSLSFIRISFLFR